jgi:hypothetical protein
MQLCSIDEFCHWPADQLITKRAPMEPDRGPKHRKPDHSSPADATSMGPSTLDRRTSTVRSSVRSHHCVRWLCGAPWRRHCQPVVRSRSE